MIKPLNSNKSRYIRSLFKIRTKTFITTATFVCQSFQFAFYRQIKNFNNIHDATFLVSISIVSIIYCTNARFILQ